MYHISVFLIVAAPQQKFKIIIMIIHIINHLIHSVSGCACHILCLLLRRQTLELLKHAVIYPIQLIHIRIYQCIKKCLLCRIIFIECTCCKSGIFHNASERCPCKSILKEMIQCCFQNILSCVLCFFCHKDSSPV